MSDALAGAAAAVVFGMAAHAAEPSFDCTNPASSAEEAVCGSEALAALDLELDRLYRAAANGPHMTPERLDELKAMQRGWIKGRDDCWKATDGLEGCVETAYAIRIHELRRGYSDARTEPGASMGPFPWVCEGLGAVLDSVFVNGPRPVVSLQWGESWIVLPQVRSGSGARYETTEPGPAQFWTKGEEALFAPPDAAEFECRRDTMD